MLLLSKPLGESLGLVLGRHAASSVYIVDVKSGSAAAAAGMRSGPRLLAVDGKTVRDLAHADDLLKKAAEVESLRLLIGDLHAPPSEEALGYARMRARGMLTSNRAGGQCLYGLACYCKMTAQLWHWLTHQSKARYYAILSALWLFFLLGLALDAISDPIVSGMSPNASYTDFALRNVISSQTAESLAAPKQRHMGMLMMLSCWSVCLLAGSSLLKCARDRLQRDDPAGWRGVTDDVEDYDSWCYRHPWLGPFCCCFFLMPRMLDALTRTGSISQPRAFLKSCQPLGPALQAAEWEIGEWV